VPTGPRNNPVPQLRQALLHGPEAGLSDGQLLERFVGRREQPALEALVRRHGPMVWGVCRRILGHHHDAEDAFQATFLVLVRKAASVLPRDRVVNWLYGVAYRTALKAKATAARRRAREVQVTAMPEPAVAEQDPWDDLRPLLDRELGRLPDKYRLVLLLCDVQGRTRGDAARELGLPEGTVASRLATARAMLAKRLARRGVTVTGGALAGVLARDAAGCVPTSVLSATLQVTCLVAAGSGAMSAPVAALTEGVLKAMWLNQLKAVTAGLLVLGLALTGGGLLTQHLAGAPQGPGATGTTSAAAQEPKAAPEKDDQTKAEGLRPQPAAGSRPYGPDQLHFFASANAAYIDEHLHGKVVQVKGHVRGVTKAVETVEVSPGQSGRQGFYFVLLGDSEWGQPLVTCRFPEKDRAGIATLFPPQIATIEGTCSVRTDGGKAEVRVWLTNCRLVAVTTKKESKESTHGKPPEGSGPEKAPEPLKKEVTGLKQ
jgi:RNA polymerase sigma factor (sigma-70 family)